MRDRENGSTQPRGGLLCDEMGLGKTLMMASYLLFPCGKRSANAAQLANIINGKPGDTSKHRATLIVAPASLIAQIDREIRLHCQHGTKYGIGLVVQHTARQKLRTNEDAKILENADIVLTTYHEVSKSMPKCVPPVELVTAAQKEVSAEVVHGG